MQFHGARAVYGSLLAAGVQIHEYQSGVLHAQVAVIVGLWATVGSSNLDPLSLLLAREANVVVRDAHFAPALRERFMAALQRQSLQVQATRYLARSAWQRALDLAALALMRLGVFVIGRRY